MTGRDQPITTRNDECSWRTRYSWGIFGADFPGGFWGVHQGSVDQEGNFYTAEVNAGRFQKFAPRPGANPAMVIQPVLP